MKRNDLLSLLASLAAPIALIALGVVLVLAPDTGSAFLSRMLGWLCSLAGVAMVLWAVFASQWSKLLPGLALWALGSFLLAKPLALAAFLGRIVGVLVILRGIRELFLSQSRGGRLLSLALTLVGVALVALPMSASRLLFAGCGAALAVCGIALLIQRLKQQRHLTDSRDDIIDAL